MVVFTCNHCGDSLQKPKVEKHYMFVCRTEKHLTCVDCFKDFRAEEYVTHTKCLTEDERYAAKGTYTNGIVKKGEIKQESWVEMIKSILDNDKSLKPSCRNLLNTISNYSNIPRKKPKFINFIKSSSGGRANMRDVEEVWNIIEKYKQEKAKGHNNVNGEADSEGSQKFNFDTEKGIKNEKNELKKRKAEDENDGSPKKKKSNKEQVADNVDEKNGVQNTGEKIKKKKSEEVKEETLETEKDGKVEQNVKFNFEKKILEIISAKQSISLKKLQKKVLNAYLKATDEMEITPKIIKKFNKKLKKVPNLEISEDKVTILLEQVN